MSPADSAPEGSMTDTEHDPAWTRELHDALRHVARAHLRAESRTITLSPTDLVHEAYLRLVALQMDFADRRHFMRVASTQMRRILVDHARKKLSGKRGERAVQVTLRAAEQAHEAELHVVDLDQLLFDLARLDPRKAQIAEMHYFGGFTQVEVAEGLDLSVATIERELKFVRGWLLHELSDNPPPRAESPP